MAVRAMSVGLGFTWTTADSELFPALASARVWLTTRVCPPSAAPVVFQLNEIVGELLRRDENVADGIGRGGVPVQGHAGGGPHRETGDALRGDGDAAR